MNDTVSSGAHEALRELLEVSPQIEVAVVATRTGELLAASLDESPSVTDLASLAARIVDQANEARSELGREPVVQCELATGDGTVFVVNDSDRVVAAVTGNEPTVGLVFYDLKTALRSVREAAAADESATAANGNGARSGKSSRKGARR